jgi:hypothetical protein
MGHNDLDYEHKFSNTIKTLSLTFGLLRVIRG